MTKFVVLPSLLEIIPAASRETGKSMKRVFQFATPGRHTVFCICCVFFSQNVPATSRELEMLTKKTALGCNSSHIGMAKMKIKKIRA